jgi:DNA-binding NarL/FixJ family response regulator
MISNYDLQFLFAEKRLANVRAYLLKTEAVDSILEAVRSALGGASFGTTAGA